MLQDWIPLTESPPWLSLELDFEQTFSELLSINWQGVENRRVVISNGNHHEGQRSRSDER
jgi:hypothetical protein